MKMLLGVLAIAALLVGCERSRPQNQKDANHCRVSEYTLGNTIVCSLDCHWIETGRAEASPVSCDTYGSKVEKR